ncbi:MAG: class I tRNA ligase family protein, partial [Planctomycetes bacterium]|nr:class I tRNA ligase family protein [Planctomycetota bacterium]
ADFISEAIDQTRGWFYSQLAISTLLFGGSGPATLPAGVAAPPADWPHPFRTCIVLGLMLGEDGQKMSKSKRNYKEPAVIFDAYGADALRWYFLAAQPPWTTIRYSEKAIRESVPEFLLRLWNVWSFFAIYARIDGFDPAALLHDPGRLEHDDLSRARGWRPAGERCELDRWMLAELADTVAHVIERMDAFDHFAAAGRISALVDGLSNWFVRRSRDRFWSAGRADLSADGNPDKLDAYWTLYEALLTVARLAAPFVPFLTEAIWRNLAVGPFGDRVPDSVHLTDYPAADGRLVDRDLVRRMALVRDVSSLGRAARAGARLKVRQPLSKVEVILADDRATDAAWLSSHADLVRDELNVKQFEVCRDPDRYITRSVLPDLKRLGPRLGKDLPRVKAALAAADVPALLAEVQRAGRATVPLAGGGSAELERDDLVIRTTAREGWAAAESASAVVVVATELSPELVAEGLVREVVHLVQAARKTLDLEFTQRIVLGLETPSPELAAALAAHRSTIDAETLAVDGPFDGAHREEHDVDGHALVITLHPLPAGAEP